VGSVVDSTGASESTITWPAGGVSAATGAGDFPAQIQDRRLQLFLTGFDQVLGDQGCLQLIDHMVEVIRQIGEFVPPAQGDAVIQLAAADRIGALHKPL
jgi:hypothetical protein